MFRRFILGLWLAALLAGSVGLLWRYRELENVRRNNASLQGQIAARNRLVESDSVRPPAGTRLQVEPPDQSFGKIAGASLTVLPTNGNLLPLTEPLTAEERNELLRLRGQVSLLRGELADASHRQSAKTRSATSTANTNIPSSGSLNLPTDHYGPGFAVAIREIRTLIRQQIEQHGGQVPAALPAEQTAQLGAEATELLGHLEMLPGETITPETDCCIFTAREREARQTADGSWVRLYFWANGSFTVAGPFTDPNWDRWERQVLGSLRESHRRRMQPK